MNTMTIADRKKSMRRLVRTLKATLSPDQKVQAAQVLATAAMAHPAIRSAQVIVSFWPMPDEIDVAALNISLATSGHDVYLPLMVGDSLRFHQFQGVNALAPDPQYGILQPRQDAPTLPQSVLDSGGAGVVIITPGMAFAPDGRRLGRGRGFYDRAFATLPNATRIGVGFHCQLLSDVPTDENDVLLHDVLLG